MSRCHPGCPGTSPCALKAESTRLPPRVACVAKLDSTVLTAGAGREGGIAQLPSQGTSAQGANSRCGVLSTQTSSGTASKGIQDECENTYFCEPHKRLVLQGEVLTVVLMLVNILFSDQYIRWVFSTQVNTVMLPGVSVFRWGRSAAAKPRPGAFADHRPARPSGFLRTAVAPASPPRHSAGSLVLALTRARRTESG